MDKQLLADSVVKGIAYAENGGKPNLANLSAGKTGEMKSIFQYTPNTWKTDSEKYLGKDTPISPDAETYVMRKKVTELMNKGYTARQIASMHNAGTGEPNAYTGKFSDGTPSVGVNKKYGVKFDVPSYANKVLAYSKQFYGENGKTQQGSSNQVTPVTVKSSGSMRGVTRGSLVKKPMLAGRRSGLLLNQKASQ